MVSLVVGLFLLASAAIYGLRRRLDASEQRLAVAEEYLEYLSHCSTLDKQAVLSFSRDGAGARNLDKLRAYVFLPTKAEALRSRLEDRREESELPPETRDVLVDLGHEEIAAVEEEIEQLRASLKASTPG